jgi:ABC-type multidrug transport system ATPase subunit
VPERRDDVVPRGRGQRFAERSGEAAEDDVGDRGREHDGHRQRQQPTRQEQRHRYAHPEQNGPSPTRVSARGGRYGSSVGETQALLRAEALAVAHRRRTILSGVDVVANAGAVISIEGSNGSGKTSLLRVLAGLSTPRAGMLARTGRCAFVPEKVGLGPAMRCREWLGAMRALRGLDALDWEAAIRTSELSPQVLDAPCAVLSKGMLQRIALLESLHSECVLLLLDEPFSGLDTPGRQWLADALRGRADRGTAVLLSDHSGAARSLLALTGGMLLEGGRCVDADLRPVAADDRAVTIVASDPEDRRVSRQVREQDVDEVLGTLIAAGWHIEEVRR